MNSIEKLTEVEMQAGLFEHAPVGYLVLDQNGLIMMINVTGARLVGSVRDSLINQPFAKFLVQTSQDVFRQHCQQVIATKEHQSCVLKLVRADGHELAVQLESIPGPDDDVHHPHLRTVLVDLSRRGQAGRSSPSAPNPADKPLNVHSTEVAQTRAKLQPGLDDTEKITATILEEHNLLRALVDNLPDIIYIKDTQSRFLLVNEATRRHLGAETADEVVGKTDFDFSPPDLAEQYFVDEQRIFQTGESLILREEPIFDHETETTRLVLTIKVPFRNDQGKIIGLVGMNRDITKLKETEAALRHAHDEVEMRVLQRTTELVKANQALTESEQRYKQLLNSVTDYIYTVQVENNQVVGTIHSPNCIAVTGYSQQEYETNPHLWYQMIHVEDRPAVVAQVNALLTNGSAEPLEHRLWHKNGSIRWVRNTAVLRKDIYGSITSYEGLLSDITARKEAEEALRQSESKYRLLMEHASDGIMIADQGGQILQVNSKTCDLLQYPRTELVGAYFSDFIPASDLAKLPLGFEELITGKTLLRERFLRRQDNALVPVEISSKMIEPNRILAILRDISERKAVERRENLAHQLGRQLTTLLDPAALLAETANRLKETFGYYHVHIYLCQQAGHEQATEPCLLIIHEGTGELGAMLKAQRFAITIDAPRSLVAQAARTLQPVVANDVNQDPTYLPNPFLTRTRSEAAFPLFLGERLIGVLDVQHSQVDHFNIHEVRTLQIIANQLSVALANAQLFAEQERLFKEVRAGRERLQHLSHRLVEVQEAERRHIARELHDAVGQLLTGLKLTLEMSAQLPSEEIRASLAEPQALVNELITRVRELSLELRPAMLDDLGLLPTLAWHFERYMVQTKLEVRLKHTGVEGQRFDPATETAAYRIIQEALTNVARYADPTRVTVQLWIEQQQLRVQIADDGVGFNLAAVQAAGRTSGLSGMAERAALLGGQLTIESEPGAGTRVTASLPLAGPASKSNSDPSS